MDRLLLVGAGGLGRVVAEHARNIFECSFIDDAYEQDILIDNIPIVGHISDLKTLYEKYDLLLVSIGNNSIRKCIYEEAKKIGYSFPNLIHKSAYISPYATIGNGCIILNNVVIQNGSSIGDGVILNPGVEIHHDSHVGNYSLIYTNSVIRTLASIGNRVKIGSTCSISNNVIVSDDTVVDDGTTIRTTC